MSAILREDAPETTWVLLLISDICRAASNRSHQLWEANSNWAVPPALLRTRGSKKGLSPRLVEMQLNKNIYSSVPSTGVLNQILEPEAALAEPPGFTAPAGGFGPA